MASSSTPSLPPTHRALILRDFAAGPSLETAPTPQPGPGSVVVRLLAAPLISYMREIYNGSRAYPLPLPLTVGHTAIARVAAVGPDAVALTPGQLVLADAFIRGRDEPGAAFLLGVHEGFDEKVRRLHREVWRDAPFAEFALLPLENVHAIDEGRVGRYSPEELAGLVPMGVPYGGLRDVGLSPGETVVVAPATGQFGAAGVQVALAMGARVVAMGRSREKLERLKGLGERVEVVPMTGDFEKDRDAVKAHGPIDVYLDISPPDAADSTHLRSCMAALRKEGRVSLMGGIYKPILIDHTIVMHNNLTLKGTWMYKREQVKELIKMVEAGVLKLGKEGGVELVGSFPLEQWKEAFDMASEVNGPMQLTVLTP